MPGLQMKLNRDLPFGNVFAGSGEQNDLDRECRAYQHGLYFGANDELLVNHPYNAKKISMLKSLGFNPDERKEVALNEEPAERAPLNPEIVSQLEAMKDEEIYAIATNLADKLREAGEVDPFKPELGNRDGNVRFVATHAS